MRDKCTDERRGWWRLSSKLDPQCAELTSTGTVLQIEMFKHHARFSPCLTTCCRTTSHASVLNSCHSVAACLKKQLSTPVDRQILPPRLWWQSCLVHLTKYSPQPQQSSIPHSHSCRTCSKIHSGRDAAKRTSLGPYIRESPDAT